MRLAVSLLVAALCSTASLLAAQQRLSVGLLVGSTSDYDRGGFLEPPAEGRQLSVGLPMRFELTRPRRLTVAATGTVEWSYAPQGTGSAGLMQLMVGPEITSAWRNVDLRAAPLVGMISRRGDRLDAGDHFQRGLEFGTGARLRSWRVGYSYRHAWVHGVRRTGSTCTPGLVCPAIFVQDAPTVETYNRHALELTRRF